jgi:UDP-glucose 4-epimerase
VAFKERMLSETKRELDQETEKIQRLEGDLRDAKAKERELKATMEWASSRESLKEKVKQILEYNHLRI